MARVTETQSLPADRKTATPFSILAKQRSGSPAVRKSPSKSSSPAAEDNAAETVSDGTGMRLTSPIFTILAGEDKHKFTAHEGVLSQSSVMSRFCKSNFREASTKEIALPNESRETVGRLLEYLYSGDYACHKVDKPFEQAVELAGMYIVADKYNLPGLKRLTTTKLVGLKSFPVERIELFTLANLVYGHIPDSDQDFRAYFASYAPVKIMEMDETESNQLEEMMKTGGTFAQDCFRAQKQAWLNKVDNMAKRGAQDPALSTPPAKKGGRGNSSKAKATT
ncbi:MAG: hypothetical protein FRX48_09695 [Lasallia pustulata]|uniref:BTB domain-containing protein n=1 Tax=Lasallia pustulata TaxID=136370 RepID=A0A5M8PC58_9LECA|nr:MAG: hypothetical protein FRX48_09695 [Lasallia pustulata]